MRVPVSLFLAWPHRYFSGGRIWGALGLVEIFDGKLTGDTVAGDGETAAKASAKLDQKGVEIVLL
jgi:hypothetical protein